MSRLAYSNYDDRGVAEYERQQHESDAFSAVIELMMKESAWFESWLSDDMEVFDAAMESDLANLLFKTSGELTARYRQYEADMYKWEVSPSPKHFIHCIGFMHDCEAMMKELHQLILSDTSSSLYAALESHCEYAYRRKHG